MDDIFLTRLVIENVGPLHHVDIGLSPRERKHLMLTGKNGSGKTMVLTALRETIQAEALSPSTLRQAQDIAQIGNHQPASQRIVIEWNVQQPLQESWLSHQFIMVCHDARTHLQVERFNAMALKFPILDEMLRHLFQDHTLQLHYSPTSGMFNVQANNRPPLDLATISDGYAVILSLLSELLLRIAPIPTAKDETPGIALIDGIETFLDADLQKRILPFLIEEFPKFQFIVTTHSRLVMNSFEPAVIFDLDRQHRIDDRLIYPYDAIIEQYDLSQHSDQIKQMLEEYEQLLSKKMKTEDEEYRILELGGYLAWIIHKFQKTPKSS